MPNIKEIAVKVNRAMDKRDAPVVGYFDSEYIDFSRHNRIGWKPLIFKPGEQ